MAAVYSESAVARLRRDRRAVEARPLAEGLLLVGRLLLVPAEQCALLTLEVPSRRRRDIEAALPFLLEEHLAQPAQELRWAWRSDGGRVRVLAVDAGRLERWRGLLPEDSGGAALRLLPDIAALPYEEGRWSLYRQRDRLLLRTGIWSGLACTLDEAPSLLRVLCRQTRPERGVLLLEGGPVRVAAEALPLPEGVEIECRRGGVQWPASAPRNLPCLPLAPQETAAPGGSGRWWAAALLLLLSGTALHTLDLWRETSRLEQRREELETRALSLFREAFPGARRIVNPRVQAEKRLEALEAEARERAAGGLLPLLYRVGERVRKEAGARLLHLRYQAPALSLTLELADADAAGRLAAALSGERGYRAELRSTRSEGGRTVARLRITRP